MSTKTWVRSVAARLLYRSGLTDPKWRSRGRLSIVTFHRVLTELERQAYPYPGLVVTPHELDAFLTCFTRNFDCGALRAQHERYVSGERPDRPLLALTFDDGQYDNYLNALPVLARHNFKAAFFAPVAAIERRELLWPDRLGFAIIRLAKGNRDTQERLMRILSAAGLSGHGPRSLVENAVEECKRLTLDARLSLIDALAEAAGTAQTPEYARLMTFDELANLAAAGHEIGSHSMTHCLMPECDDRALAYEVSESRNVLQERLAQPVDSFCYPNGNCDPRTALAVEKAGYRRAVTTAWGHNGPGVDRFQLHRFDMDVERVLDATGKFQPDLVAFRMSGFYPGLG
jgi:peptidoglycan/xylan/chitin deacetylase (PgdA/CDA1 family)